MLVKDLWEKFLCWLRLKRRHRFDLYSDIDDAGLISTTCGDDEGGDQVLVRKVDKQQSIDRLQEGFNRLVDELGHINTNFANHLSLQKEMMDKIEQMPRIMENFPAAIENQRSVMEQLGEQFKTTTAKTQEFVDSVKKLPEESMRQTDTLISINRQLGLAADADILLGENFAKFNLTLEQLKMATASQTESVMQMSKTFAASDRYLKYLVDKQNRRFMWVFYVAIGVSVFSILALITIIAFLK